MLKDAKNNATGTFDFQAFLKQAKQSTGDQNLPTKMLWRKTTHHDQQCISRFIWALASQTKFLLFFNDMLTFAEESKRVCKILNKFGKYNAHEFKIKIYKAAWAYKMCFKFVTILGQYILFWHAQNRESCAIYTLIYISTINTALHTRFQA